MGCVLRMYGEVQRDGKWQLAEPLERNTMTFAVEARDEPEWIPVELGGDTNSPLFAILANFGRHRSGPFRCIAEPRGLPIDVTAEVKEYFDSFGDNAEAPSWLLVQEINDFDWKSLTDTHSAMVDQRAAHLFRSDKAGKPCVGFPYAEWPEGLTISYGEWMRDGVRVEWVETHEEAVGRSFLHDLIAKLQRYGKPDKVRVVFWFDC